MIQAIKGANSLPRNQIIQFPSGKFGFVGRVSEELASKSLPSREYAEAWKIAIELKELNSPTSGEYAAMFWQLLSSSYYVSPRDAKEIYQVGGYVPFVGYPLERSQK